MARAKESRKQRRERFKYAPILRHLVNAYIIAKQQSEVELILKHKYNALRNEWKKFVHNWNRNPKHSTTLKDSDFDDLIKDLKHEA